jgi:uncharacterized protein
LNAHSNSNRRGAAARVLLVLLRAYRATASPMTFSACKFYPTCSRYASEAIERFGARRGAWLAFRRLLRCHPFKRGGFDPVPDAWEDNKTHARHKQEYAR